MTNAPLPADGQAQQVGQSIQASEQPRDAPYWSHSASELKVSNVPSGALNLNVDGKLAVGPLQGFGKMWQKTYRIALKGATVEAKEVILTWKKNFPRFWPAGNRFYAPLTGIAPGEVALLSIKAGGVALSTGVLVLYADEESFTLMTPQGHVFAGWITFSAYAESDVVVVQAQVLMRANDPIYELGLRFGGHKQEDLFWQHTLKSLAAEFGVSAQVQTEVVCIDPRLQWSQAKNIWHNAAMRTTIYRVTTPLRWIRGKRT
ncbi:MAG TPA: hypothetical protein VGT44_00500 [Ktedonobacteraceae bacterium]|nr:hypothetical protein [Ktedonobacteraceae bacterium]